ncbi:transcription-repair coupling factor [Candidatus Liberibacter solanacearum]|uniref:Transcription-repair-coupling factor n=1 Tax=Candidatus Liberibacter solanacearum TaxID=556287 RepID=A0A1V2N7I9_9HYPH|nr:transcription-repair coupling factor [Candidatus Liberibacter solanacearum]ONI58867.1 transcription-repair coupling factor [Candidatus Liberibacter solanacearum]ONI59514.1 transcription-repair coupling factor [Candidatus Liberibacter solanacearum]
MIFGDYINKINEKPCKKITLSQVFPGTEPFVLAEIARSGLSLVYIGSDERALVNIKKTLAFIVPDIDVIIFPAWDCLPYDRISASPRVVTDRLACFSHLISCNPSKKTSIILTTVSAVMCRSVNFMSIKDYKFSIQSKDQISMEKVIEKLEKNGFQRVNTVYKVGEYAVRGGILDVYGPSEKYPVRLDFFGDTIESLRLFDYASQRTIREISTFTINTLSEVVLTSENISLFRKNYLLNFGAATQKDLLYVTVSQGNRYPGMEHWLPFFYQKMETIFSYLADFCIVTDSAVKDTAHKRSQLIQDYYEARYQHSSDKKNYSIYKPILPEKLYLTYQQFEAMLESSNKLIQMTPFSQQETSHSCVVCLNVRPGKSWVPSAVQKIESQENWESMNRFDRFLSYVAQQFQKGKKAFIAASSKGALQHLIHLMKSDGLNKIKKIDCFNEIHSLAKEEIAAAVLPIDQGFETGNMILVTEKDLLGKRIIRRTVRKSSLANSFFESSNIEEGSIIVHAEHGIGRFIRLSSIKVSGTSHDCLELHYADNAKLFVPVENIDLISQYSTENETIMLDKLGGSSWQSRKSNLKKRLEDLAQKLVDIAAKRLIHNVPALTVSQDLYSQFVKKFPHVETEDQEKAVDSVIQDFASGHLMDRLICGDVGFGKTEIALRAAFIAVMNGLQVAVIAPTTLLVRQHFRLFSERFQDFPVRIVSVSRFVKPKEVALHKKAIAEGQVDIVIGTHALLDPKITFSNLGLIIVDEEQHFGVKHKEALKETHTGVHVLTLSATPIPRTLQLAITGVRELSLISMPPINRIACRTSISIFDPLLIRETLMREYYRGGQSFYVCPRLLDLDKCYDFLQSEVPELKVAMAHGQMSPKNLEETMNGFYERKYDILLSTSIVESGLDLPNANTIIIQRADMFGLAQLYQLRGRVGRSKISSFALFLLPENKPLTSSAQKRLRILQSLNTLGAGFQLASHDLDIRGTGNLLGEEQSGHIKEVGFELYQKMLGETVASIKGKRELVDSDWSPQIMIEASVMIPDSYVSDVNLRLSLYRRLGNITDHTDINRFKEEMVDRFGSLPIEVVHLLKVLFLKLLCRIANIEKMDIGPKGIIVQFRNKKFHNPEKLLQYIMQQQGKIIIRPDQSLFFDCLLPTINKRFIEAKHTLSQLIKLIDVDIQKCDKNDSASLKVK